MKERQVGAPFMIAVRAVRWHKGTCLRTVEDFNATGLQVAAAERASCGGGKASTASRAAVCRCSRPLVITGLTAAASRTKRGGRLRATCGHDTKIC